MKRKLNKDRLFTFILIVFGFILLTFVGVKVYLDFFKDNEGSVVELKRLDLYGYTLESRDTELYKENFNELSDTLNTEEIDYDKYAELLSKLFIIDFYTLSNKIASTDIGSVDFVYPDMKDNFIASAEDTMYKYIKNNFNGKRSQKLPEVSEVNIENINNEKFNYNEKEYDSYKINASWQYVEDLKYENSSILTLIKDGSKLYVVECD